MDKFGIPVHNKLNLTIEEAAEYSNIGVNLIRKLIKTPYNKFTLRIGSRTLIKRKEFEEFLSLKREL